MGETPPPITCFGEHPPCCPAVKCDSLTERRTTIWESHVLLCKMPCCGRSCSFWGRVWGCLGLALSCVSAAALVRGSAVYLSGFGVQLCICCCLGLWFSCVFSAVSVWSSAVYLLLSRFTAWLYLPDVGVVVGGPAEQEAAVWTESRPHVVRAVLVAREPRHCNVEWYIIDHQDKKNKPRNWWISDRGTGSTKLRTKLEFSQTVRNFNECVLQSGLRFYHGGGDGFTVCKQWFSPWSSRVRGPVASCFSQLCGQFFLFQGLFLQRIFRIGFSTPRHGFTQSDGFTDCRHWYVMVLPCAGGGFSSWSFRRLGFSVFSRCTLY